MTATQNSLLWVPGQPSPSGQRPIDQAHDTFRRWLGDEYDIDVLDAVLCAVAVERLDGDPLWILVVAGSGAAKTETVAACAGAGAFVESTLTGPAALLSGTPGKERAKNATGGLLRRFDKQGKRGVLVLKDVTSILSISRDRRAEILSALREIADGRWSRSIGSEGGHTIDWQGRIVVIGAVTTAWDSAHEAIAKMGDRFVLIRLRYDANGRVSAARHAAANTGSETIMRAELADTVKAVVDGIDTKADLTLGESEIEQLVAAANLVTRARTAVDHDYQGNVIDAHEPEMPTRFLKQLQQMVRGGIAIGINRERAMRLAIRCARDSVPPLRLAVLEHVAENPHSRPSEIRAHLGKPWRTIDRTCQALHMLDVLGCDETTEPGGDKTVWRYYLAEGIDPKALQP